ncbi:MAG: hypothetical protein WAO61_09305 [Solirubrobacterales bacterium]
MRLATAVAVLAAVAAPGNARAEFTNSFALSPSTTAAGANPDLNFSFAFPGAPEVKSLAVTLPRGLNVGPRAISTPCPLAVAAAGACDPSSQIGTVSASALGSVTAFGDLFMTAPPSPIDVAGIAITLRVDGDRGTVVAQGSLRLDNMRTNQPRQRIRFAKIPRVTSTGAAFALTELTMSMGGWPSASEYPLVTNPSSCPTSAYSATSTAKAYDNTSSRSSSAYPTTGCADLQFSPTFDETFSDPIAGHSTDATFTIGMPLGHSSVRHLSLKLAPF